MAQTHLQCYISTFQISTTLAALVFTESCKLYRHKINTNIKLLSFDHFHLGTYGPVSLVNWSLWSKLGSNLLQIWFYLSEVSWCLMLDVVVISWDCYVSILQGYNLLYDWFWVWILIWWLEVDCQCSHKNYKFVKVTMARWKVKSRSHPDVAHLHPLTNVPIKYQLPAPYSLCDIAQTRF